MPHNIIMKGGDTMKVIAPVSDLLGRRGKRRNPFIVYWFSSLFHMKGGDTMKVIAPRPDLLDILVNRGSKRPKFPIVYWSPAYSTWKVVIFMDNRDSFILGVLAGILLGDDDWPRSLAMGGDIGSLDPKKRKEVLAWTIS